MVLAGGPSVIVGPVASYMWYLWIEISAAYCNVFAILTENPVLMEAAKETFWLMWRALWCDVFSKTQIFTICLLPLAKPWQQRLKDQLPHLITKARLTRQQQKVAQRWHAGEFFHINLGVKSKCCMGWSVEVTHINPVYKNPISKWLIRGLAMSLLHVFDWQTVQILFFS